MAFFPRLLVCLVVLITLDGVLAADSPGDSRVKLDVPLKTPRGRDPVLGGSRDKVVVAVWIPEGLKTVRGLMCNPFSKDEDVSKHWKAACRLWQFAFVQVDFDGVKKDEFALLPAALVELAKMTGHPELERVPFCFTGMSRGGGMSMSLAEMMPERTIACVPVCLEVGPASEATRRVPVTTVFGEKDGSQMEKLLAKLPAERKLGARFAIAPQWGRKHEFALANNLSFVFLDDVIARRVGSTHADIPLESGWLGDVSTWGKDGRIPAIAPWKDFAGNRDAACWFPRQRTAAVWQAFVGASKSVTIAEPPGLGDGQPFVPHTSTKPVVVKLEIKGKAEKVELRDADVKRAERTTAPWTFEVALKAGIHSLIAVVHEGGATRTSRPHTIVVE